MISFLSRLRPTVLVAQVAVIVYELIQGDALGVGVATVALLLTLSTNAAPLTVAVIGSVAFSEWGAAIGAAAAAVPLLTAHLGRGGWTRPRVNSDALRESTDRCGQLLPNLGFLTTASIVGAAAEANPARWNDFLVSERDDDDTWDGPVLEPSPAVGGATTMVGEACGLALHLSAELNVPLTLDLIAASAACLPLTSASAMVGAPFSPLLEISGGHPNQITELMSSFAETPAGADLMRRVELPTGFPMAREYRYRQRPGPFVWVSTAAYIARHPATREIIGDLVRDAVTFTRSAPRRVVNTVRHRLTRANRPATSGPTTTKRPKRRRPTLGERINKRTLPWAAWPLPSRVAWLVARPACVIATPVLAALTLPWVAAVAVGVLGVAIRPTRRPLPAVLLAAATASLGSFAAIPIVGRLLLTEALLVHQGAGANGWRERRRAGIASVVAARRALLETEPAEQVLASILNPEPGEDGTVETRDIFDQLDDGLNYVAAATTEADFVTTARALRTTFRGIVRGRWTLSDDATLSQGIMQMALAEASARGLSRVLSIAAAIIAAAALAPDRAVTIGPLHPSATVTAAGLGAWIATGSTAVASGWVTAIIGAIVGRILLGPAGLLIAAIGAAARLPVSRAQEVVVEMMVGAKTRAATLRWTETGLRLHEAWTAATIASRDGLPGTAINILRGIESAPDTKPVLRAAALAQIGTLELQRGNSDVALTATDQARALLDDNRKVSRPHALALVGIAEVRRGLGQDVLGFLPDAMAKLPAGWPETIRAASICAEAHARAGNTDEAIAVLTRARKGRRIAPDFTWILDSELTVAQALSAEGKTEHARRRLQAAIEHLDHTPDIFVDGGTGNRMVRASARAAVLLGTLELDAGNTDAAANAFQNALSRLDPTEPVLVATASIMYSATLIRQSQWDRALRQLETGIDLIERQRRNIARGDARTQAIVSNARLYRTALSTLTALQDNGYPQAGDIAAVLVETLHQSALTQTLNDGTLQLGAQVQELLDEIDTLQQNSENEPPDDGTRSTSPDPRLQRRAEELGALVGAAFARHYTQPKCDLIELRTTLGRSHVLSYFFPDDAHWPDGYCIWIPPTGSPVIHEVRFEEGPARALVTELAVGNTTGVVPLARPAGAPGAPWSSLATALLPPGLHDRLQVHGDDNPLCLVIVPDHTLTRVPWGALKLSDGRLLIEAAAPQVIPSLDLIDGTDSEPLSTDTIVFHADPTLTRVDDNGLPTTAGLQHPQLIPAAKRADVERLLRHAVPGGIVLAVHGDGTGLTQRVHLADGTSITAAQALQLPWPDWVLIAACFAGGVDHHAGSEPLGMPIACLLGGSRSVIGATTAVLTHRADEVTAALLDPLAKRMPPALALRAAVVGLRHRPVADWATFTCVSRRRP